MISYYQFLPVISHLLLEQRGICSFAFNPPHICDPKSLAPATNVDHTTGRVIWYHEEPLESEVLKNLMQSLFKNSFESEYSSGMHSKCGDINITILANSEKSDLKKLWIKENQLHVLDWYFFFHGFLTLDWYRDYKFYNFSTNRYSKLFSCFNHLISEKRSYRLYLLSKLAEEKLLDHGHFSCPNLSPGVVKTELLNPNSGLSVSAKKHIYQHLLPIAQPYILDQVDYNNASADLNPYLIDAWWNIVTETVFYDNKLHLTEKIFKPIVAKKPFILVGAPGNLQYLKSYGFKTFEDFIDERYDSMLDPVDRINYIVLEIKKLSKLDTNEKEKMINEINKICEYNHYHFYKEFPRIITNELVDNFETCLKQYNLARYSTRYQIDNDIDFVKIKNQFLRYI